jgi:hypothetical protein
MKVKLRLKNHGIPPESLVQSQYKVANPEQLAQSQKLPPNITCRVLMQSFVIALFEEATRMLGYTLLSLGARLQSYLSKATEKPPF